MKFIRITLFALIALASFGASAVKISELGTGQKVGNILDETLLVGGGATTAATPTLTIPRTDSGTNVVAYLLRLQRESSGTPAAGIGTGIEFRAETAAGNVETGATIEAVTTDVTSTSEDFDLWFSTMSAGGAAARRVKINYAGIRILSFNGSPSYDVGSDNVQGVQAFTLFGSGGAVGIGSIEFSGFVVASNKGYYVSSGNSNDNGKDTGLVRVAPAVWRASNASSGTGVVLQAALVEASTAGSGTPNVLVNTESGTVLTNEGATAQNYHTLPTAAAGLVFEFVVQDADGIRVVAATGDTIQDVGTVSATAGYIQSTTIGSVIRLAAINATQWVVMSKQGAWTVDS